MKYNFDEAIDQHNIRIIGLLQYLHSTIDPQLSICTRFSH